MVYFVGAGAGDPELLTVKGKRLIDNADTIIYAGSLVNPAVLADRRPDCQVYDSAGMTLEEVLAVMQETEAQGKTTVRVHTGDASIYGAIREQLDALDKLGIPHTVVPGVSSFLAAAAAIMAAVAAETREGDSICTRCELRERKPGGESCPAFFPSVIKNSKNTLKIGATGFEPATSRPPAERATKLRHTPKINHSCTLPNVQLTYTAIC